MLFTDEDGQKLIIEKERNGQRVLEIQGEDASGNFTYVSFTARQDDVDEINSAIQ